MGMVPKAGGYKNKVRLLSVLLFYRIFWNKMNLFSPTPIVRENSVRGGALHNLRRSIPLHQKHKMDSGWFPIRWLLLNISCICVFGFNGEYWSLTITSWDWRSRWKEVEALTPSIMSSHYVTSCKHIHNSYSLFILVCCGNGFW